MAKVLRLLKTGGYSYCSSPEHLVGKGRCNHVPGMCFKQEQVNGMTCVEIESLDGNSKVPSTKVNVKELDDYITNLDNKLTKEKKESIVKFFESYKG